MIDVSDKLVPILRQELGIPVVSEHIFDSKTPLPCLTWQLYDDSSYATSTTIEYSRVIYYLKVWGKSMEELVNYSIKLDKIMREIGFKRTNCIDTWLDNVGQRALKYQGLSYEDYKEDNTNG